MTQQIRIVLVEPSHPGNIGSAARAMKTMDVYDLALVRPLRFPDPQADWRAAGALDVVANAVVHDEISDAVRDCVMVVGTSVRDRHIPWPVLSAEELAHKIVNDVPDGQCAAILFGRETSGLTNEELALCNHHVRIPSSERYGSLNLAMSVQVVVYELFKVRYSMHNLQPWDKPWATNEEVERFYSHLQEVLTEIDFYDPESPREAMTRLRRLFTRINLDHTEVQILRGILSHIQKAIEHPLSENPN